MRNVGSSTIPPHHTAWEDVRMWQVRNAGLGDEDKVLPAYLPTTMGGCKDVESMECQQLSASIIMRDHICALSSARYLPPVGAYNL